MEEQSDMIIGDREKEKTPQEFYSEFKEKLEEVHHFPCKYVYKFIVPASEEKIALINSIFENVEANFSSRDSKNKKYISLTVSYQAQSAEEVIRYYQEVASIPGVVLL